MNAFANQVLSGLVEKFREKEAAHGKAIARLVKVPTSLDQLHEFVEANAAYEKALAEHRSAALAIAMFVSENGIESDAGAVAVAP